LLTKTEDENSGSAHDHGDHGGDLDEGEPELQLAKQTHACQVDGPHDQQR